MKKLRTILSIVLSSTLIASTMGFSVSRHYCMGMLVEENFYGPSEDCGMDMSGPCEDSHDSLKKGCCENEDLVFAGIDVISFVKKQLDVNDFYTADWPSPVIFNKPRAQYSPSLVPAPPEPLPYGRDLLARVQCFLI